MTLRLPGPPMAFFPSDPADCEDPRPMPAAAPPAGSTCVVPPGLASFPQWMWSNKCL